MPISEGMRSRRKSLPPVLLAQGLVLLGLLSSSAAKAEVQYRIRTEPAPTLEGYTTYTFSLLSEADKPINGVDGGFFGAFNQVNPGDVSTLYQDYNAFFDFVPEQVGDDSQFLFDTSDVLHLNSGSVESNSQLAAVFTNIETLPEPFDPTSFDLAQLVVPTGNSFTFDLALDVDNEVVQLSGGILIKHLSAVSSPASGSTISLQTAFNHGKGLLDDAVMLSADGVGNLIIGEAFIDNDPHNLFAVIIDGLNIDVTLDMQIAKTLPPGPVTAELLVGTNGGDLSYFLTVTIPEPATVWLILIAALSVVGLARRHVG